MDQELANKEAQRKRQELINKGEKPDEGPRTPPVAEPISFSLPKADYILSTEAEVDAYLTSIRQQLMHMILSNKKIIIK
jgi:flagellar biosynthesis/type III secretory pathway protein FliH